jgi:hypothetical protein
VLDLDTLPRSLRVRYLPGGQQTAEPCDQPPAVMQKQLEAVNKDEAAMDVPTKRVMAFREG